MKHIIIIFVLLLATLIGYSQEHVGTGKLADEFYRITKAWFSAWELVSRGILKIDKVKNVDFVFFDEKYVYSTSNVTIPNGENVEGASLMNLALHWKRTLHNDTLTLADESRVPVGLMSFASEIPKNPNKSFFVMPLPSFWDKMNVNSSELGLHNLITGIFVHEFSHSQQMQNFGKQVTALEKENSYHGEFNDDIIQNIFKNDSTYVRSYLREVDIFYSATTGIQLDRKLLREGITSLRKRQEKYFTGSYRNLKKADDLFLTMEGLGQFLMYEWLIHPRGANIDKSTAIKGVRRGKKQWSQDEGFALFLILNSLLKPEFWKDKMFGAKTETIVELINSKI